MHPNLPSRASLISTGSSSWAPQNLQANQVRPFSTCSPLALLFSKPRLFGPTILIWECPGSGGGSPQSHSISPSSTLRTESHTSVWTGQCRGSWGRLLPVPTTAYKAQPTVCGMDSFGSVFTVLDIPTSTEPIAFSLHVPQSCQQDLSILGDSC